MVCGLTVCILSVERQGARCCGTATQVCALREIEIGRVECVILRIMARNYVVSGGMFMCWIFMDGVTAAEGCV